MSGRPAKYANMVCSVVGCGRAVNSHGLCKAHRLRQVRGIDMNKPLRKRGNSELRVLLDQVVTICEYHSAETGRELASLFKRLEPK